MCNRMKKRTRASIALTGLLAVCLPRAAHAQECKDLGEKDFLTEAWFNDAADCALDGALDKGKSLLGDLAMSLLGSAVEAYLPGLKSVFGLGGGGLDPRLEAKFQEVLDRLDEVESTMVATVNAMANTEDFTTYVALVEATREYFADPPAERFFAYDRAATLRDDWRLLRRALEEHQHGMRAWNVYLAVVDTELRLVADLEYSERLGTVAASAADVANLSSDQLSEVESQAKEGVLTAREIMLENVLAHIQRLLEGPGGFRYHSDVRFPPYTKEVFYPDFSRETYEFPRIQNPEQFGLKVEDLPPGRQCMLEWFEDHGTCDSPADSAAAACSPWQRNWAAEGILPNYDFGAAMLSCTDASGNSEYWLTRRGGRKEALDAAYEAHKDIEYDRFLLQAYGPYRPTIDQWRQSLENGLDPAGYWFSHVPSLPITAADEALDTMVLEYSPGERMYRDTPRTGWHQIWGLSHAWQPDAQDRRHLANYALVYGTDSWPALRDAIVEGDPTRVVGWIPAWELRHLLTRYISPDDVRERYTGHYVNKQALASLAADWEESAVGRGLLVEYGYAYGPDAWASLREAVVEGDWLRGARMSGLELRDLLAQYISPQDAEARYHERSAALVVSLPLL